MSDIPRLGPVDLRVTDTGRAAAFWRDIIGLPLIGADDAVVMGFAGHPLIRLHPGATGPMPDMAAGLLHIALQVPTASDLARTAARLAASGLRHSGQDHLLSRSLYIADPDGNKIEVTLLTPDRGTITVEDGRIRGLTLAGQPHSILEPLDLTVLRSSLAPGDTAVATMPDTTINGHIHFRSRDLGAAFDFYGRLLGLMPNIFAPASQFCDLGRKSHPHLIALNMWAGNRLIDAPPGAAGMIACTLVLPAPDEAALHLRAAGHIVTDGAVGYDVTDPDGNRLNLVAP